VSWSLLELTLRVAVVATLVNIPLALGVSWLLVKTRIPGRFVLDVLVSLPLAVPPVAIGFFLLLLLGREGPIGGIVHAVLGADIVFTWVGAAIASAVVSFPLMARATMVAMSGVDELLEKSARSLGAGPWRVFLTITIPLAYRGIIAGVLLGFVRALSEFGATITVAGNIAGKTQTLPLALYSAVLLRDDALAFQLIAVIIVIAIVTLVVHNWLLAKTIRAEVS
jgi:molybdate transport system permease protein